jgi:hypothetical protein
MSSSTGAAPARKVTHLLTVEIDLYILLYRSTHCASVTDIFRLLSQPTSPHPCGRVSSPVKRWRKSCQCLSKFAADDLPEGTDVAFLMPVPGQVMDGFPRLFRRNPGYTRLWFGQGLSTLGDVLCNAVSSTGTAVAGSGIAVGATIGGGIGGLAGPPRARSSCRPRRRTKSAVGCSPGTRSWCTSRSCRVWPAAQSWPT